MKKEMLGFLRQDDTPSHLIERLLDLKTTRASAGDRLGKVVKDLTVVGRIFSGHEKRQKKANRPGLTKGAQYLENLCRFDVESVLKPVNEDISKVEAEIAKWKASSRERLRDRLIALFIEIDDGAVYQQAQK